MNPPAGVRSRRVIALTQWMVALCLFAMTSQVGRAEVQWHSDIERALQLAASSGRPVLMEFTASWCVYCRKMEKTTFTEPELSARINSQFVAIQVDADKNKELVRELEIKGLPAILVVASDLTIMSRISGFQTSEALTQKLNSIPFPNGKPSPAAAPSPVAAPSPAAAPPQFDFGKRGANPHFARPAIANSAPPTVASPNARPAQVRPVQVRPVNPEMPEIDLFDSNPRPAQTAVNTSDTSATPAGQPTSVTTASQNRSARTQFANHESDPFANFEPPTQQVSRSADESASSETALNELELPTLDLENSRSAADPQFGTDPLAALEETARGTRSVGNSAKTELLESVNPFDEESSSSAAASNNSSSADPAETNPFESPNAFGSWTIADEPLPANRSVQNPRADNHGEGARSGNTGSRSNNSSAAVPSASLPAFEGVCVVSAVDQREIVTGMPAIQTRYRGKLLQFRSEANKAGFLTNPEKYWPMLDGVCPMTLADTGRKVQGSFEFAAVFRKRIWLFTSEEKMNAFLEEPAEAVEEALERL